MQDVRACRCPALPLLAVVLAVSEELVANNGSPASGCSYQQVVASNRLPATSTGGNTLLATWRGDREVGTRGALQERQGRAVWGWQAAWPESTVKMGPGDAIGGTIGGGIDGGAGGAGGIGIIEPPTKSATERGRSSNWPKLKPRTPVIEVKYMP